METCNGVAPMKPVALPDVADRFGDRTVFFEPPRMKWEISEVRFSQNGNVSVTDHFRPTTRGRSHSLPAGRDFDSRDAELVRHFPNEHARGRPGPECRRRNGGARP